MPKQTIRTGQPAQDSEPTGFVGFTRGVDLRVGIELPAGYKVIDGNNVEVDHDGERASVWLPLTRFAANDLIRAVRNGRDGAYGADA